MSGNVATGLASVRAAIERAAAANGREAASITLVAVSKTIAVSGIEEALAAGQRVFGENRVQEAKAKWPELKQRFPDIELHLIGPLADEQGARCRRPFRRHPFRRSREPRGRAREGDRQAQG